MTPTQLRSKWRIALASNFFKPNNTFLRELVLGNQFTYSFSPWGVLCQISQLGEFIEDRNPSWRGEKDTIKSAYIVVNSPDGQQSRLPSGITDLSGYPHCYSLEVPPTKVVEAAGLADRRFPYQSAASFLSSLYFTPTEARDGGLTNYTTIGYYVRLKDILKTPSIPRSELYPLIARILEQAEPRFAARA